MLRVYFKHFFLVTSLSFLLWPQIAVADNPPNLISPSDNLIINNSPKLTWEYSGGCVESGSCFRAEVDNSPDFSSPEKSTYTNNYSYSPQDLAQGVWSWRVKAKDKDKNWSDWSKSQKFTISTASPLTQQPSSSPAPSTQPSPESQKTQSIFEIKDIPSEINSDQEFESAVSLNLPSNPNQSFYIKGAFKKIGSSNYFGQTYSNGWAANSEKYSKQLKITTNSIGVWEGKIKVKPDPDDSGFQGSGSFIFKVARYTDSGSGPTWSNEISLKISGVSKSSSSAPPEAEEVSEKKEEPDITASLFKESPKINEIKIASVAGESVIGNNITSEPEAKILGENQVNWFLISLGLGVLASGFGYVLYKFKKEKLNAKIFN